MNEGKPEKCTTTRESGYSSPIPLLCHPLGVSKSFRGEQGLRFAPCLAWGIPVTGDRFLSDVTGDRFLSHASV